MWSEADRLLKAGAAALYVEAPTAHFGFAPKVTVAGFHFLSGGMNSLEYARAIISTNMEMIALLQEEENPSRRPIRDGGFASCHSLNKRTVKVAEFCYLPVHRLKMSATFVPPNPNEFDRA